MKRLPIIFFLFLASVFSFDTFSPRAENSGPVDVLSFHQFAPINPDLMLDNNSATPDLFTGTMGQASPVLVSAGRKGIQPELALIYRNNRANGWVGVDYDLEIDAMERSTLLSCLQYVMNCTFA